MTTWTAIQAMRNDKASHEKHIQTHGTATTDGAEVILINTTIMTIFKTIIQTAVQEKQAT